MAKKIKKLLKAVVDESASLQLLKTDPEKLAKNLGLSGEDAKVLRRADVLVRLATNPIGEMQTTSPITITVTHRHPGLGNSGDPFSLIDLSKEKVIQVLNRVLVDEEYAQRVRQFLDLKRG